MGKFFDEEAAKVAIKAEMDKRIAAPGGRNEAPVQQFMLDILCWLPPALAARLSKAIDDANDAHEKRIDALEERLRVAETKSALRYRGVWLHDEEYQPGDFVTCEGSLWHCYTNTRSRPGEDSRVWQLAVKKGRDGKDAR